MGLLGQNENKIDISKIHNATHWLKARAARFLAKWRIMKSNSGPDRQRSGDKKSDMAIKKSLHYFQLGLDSSGNEFEINELVTLASLASAFIKTTDILLLEKSMEITLHGTEGRQIDLEADISVASKALLTLLFREDREAVLSHYGKLFHIEHKFQSITTKYTSRIEEKKRVALQEQGIVLETRDQIKEYFCDEEKMEMLRVIDFLIIKEILKV